MELDYIGFSIALVLLWFPAYLLLSTRTRRRIIRNEEGIRNGFPLGRMALAWQSWVDLVRAVAGVWILYHLSFSVDPDLERAEFYTVALPGAILLVGVLCQVLHFRRKVYCYCPFFYLVGISFGVLEWWVALYGLLAGLILAALINRAIVFLGAMAATIGTAGYLIEGFEIEWAIACALLLLPILLSLLFRRDLVPIVRKPPETD